MRQGYVIFYQKANYIKPLELFLALVSVFVWARYLKKFIGEAELQMSTISAGLLNIFATYSPVHSTVISAQLSST